MKPAQKTQLELILNDLKSFKKNELLWSFNEVPGFAVLIHNGTFLLHSAEEKEKEICGTGSYVGEVSSMIKNQKTKTKLECIEEGSAFILYKTEFITFLNKNPGLLIYFSDIVFCD